MKGEGGGTSTQTVDRFLSWGTMGHSFCPLEGHLRGYFLKCSRLEGHQGGVLFSPMEG